jgi:hypothetical protein
MAVFVVLALLVLGGFVVATYYGIWTGIFKPLQEIWKTQSREQRRGTVLGLTVITLLLVLELSLDIAQPFGRYTVGFVLGGAGVFFFVVLHLIVLGEIRKNKRSRNH